MDYIKSLFGIKPNDKTININDLKSENYVKIIQDQISNLVTIGLSPIPSTKEDKILQQADLNRYMIRTIYFIDILLMDRLNFYRNPEKAYELLSSNNSLSANSEKHYWVYISKYFNIPSVKFLTMCDSIPTNQEKGLTWITISILENTLLDSFKQIYMMNFDKRFYEKDANICEKKSDILKSLGKLHNFNLLNSFNVEIFRYYINDKNQRNVNRENLKDFDLGLDVPGMMSPIRKQKTMEFILTPVDLLPRGSNTSAINNAVNNYNNQNAIYQPSSNFYNSKNDMSNLNIYQSRISIRDTRDLNSKSEDIFKLINADESGLGIEENDDLLPEAEEEKEPEDIKEKDHPRNTKIISVADANIHFRENKNLGFVKKNTFFNNQTQNQNENIATYNISKYMDIHQCLKENYFMNLFNYSNLGGKKDPGVVSAIGNRDSRYFPFDRYFRINKKVEKDKFSRKDIIYYNNSQIKMTNSIVFYMNNFYKKKEFFVFDTKLKNEKPITIEAQNHQCQLCRTKFPFYSNILPFIKIFWCSYYKRYICEQCVADEFSIIPAFVLKQWNFQKFSVSKEAIELIKKWYEKPIIYFKSDDPLIKTSSLLKQTIVIKRKIHKIYDIIKCSEPEKIAVEILGEYSYLVLKENLFSLRDLWEIHNTTFIFKIKDFMLKLEYHIKNQCQICNYKGGLCAMCATGEPITAYDIENAFFCSECNSLFHKKCCSVHPCLVNKM